MSKFSTHVIGQTGSQVMQGWVQLQ